MTPMEAQLLRLSERNATLEELVQLQERLIDRLQRRLAESRGLLPLPEIDPAVDLTPALMPRSVLNAVRDIANGVSVATAPAEAAAPDAPSVPSESNEPDAPPRGASRGPGCPICGAPWTQPASFGSFNEVWSCFSCGALLRHGRRLGPDNKVGGGE